MSWTNKTPNKLGNVCSTESPANGTILAMTWTKKDLFFDPRCHLKTFDKYTCLFHHYIIIPRFIRCCGYMHPMWLELLINKNSSQRLELNWSDNFILWQKLNHPDLWLFLQVAGETFQPWQCKCWFISLLTAACQVAPNSWGGSNGWCLTRVFAKAWNGTGPSIWFGHSRNLMICLWTR